MDDDEALKEEEEEVLRLQKEHAKGIEEADFDLGPEEAHQELPAKSPTVRHDYKPAISIHSS